MEPHLLLSIPSISSTTTWATFSQSSGSSSSWTGHFSCCTCWFLPLSRGGKCEEEHADTVVGSYALCLFYDAFIPAVVTEHPESPVHGHWGQSPRWRFFLVHMSCLSSTQSTTAPLAGPGRTEATRGQVSTDQGLARSLSRGRTYKYRSIVPSICLASLHRVVTSVSRTR